MEIPGFGQFAWGKLLNPIFDLDKACEKHILWLLGGTSGGMFLKSLQFLVTRPMEIKTDQKIYSMFT